MPQCSVFSCSEKKCLHRFPQGDKTTCQVWIQRCFRKDKFNVQNAGICKIYFKNSCYERDMRNELLGLEPRRLLKPGSVPTLHLPTTHTYPSDSSERASRAKKRVQPTADDVIVHDTTLAVTRILSPI